MIDTTAPYTSQPIKPKNKNKTIVIVVLLAVFVVAGIFIYGQVKKNEQKKALPTPTKEPTPTEKPEIDKKLVKIRVLNGTGTPGQAGEVAKILKEEGYGEENITTGNADEFGQKTTTITSRSGFEEVAENIKTALEEKFDKVEIESSPLEEESEYDIVIITGGKKYEEPTTSPSPTSTTPTETVTPINTPTPTITSSPTTSP